MQEVDHNLIRSSILPFGYNADTKAYRFSLCIDMIPNYPDNLANDKIQIIYDSLKGFYKEYYNTVEKLKTELSITLKEQASPANTIIPKESIILCFPELMDQTKEVWNELNSLFSPRTENLYDGILLTPGLKTKAEHTDSMFSKLPDADAPRKKIIDSYVQFAKNQTEFDIEKLKLNAIFSSETKKDIARFDKVLNGIIEFSSGQNDFQTGLFTKNLLKDTTKQLADIRDSVDTLLDTWAFFDSNYLLQRLTGKTIDFEISQDYLEKQLKPDVSTFELQFNLPKTFGEIGWEHSITPVQIFKKECLILVNEAEQVNIKRSINGKNYDIGGKLVALKSVEQKFENYEQKLKDPSIKTSEKNLIIKQLLKADSAALTTGITLYENNLKEILKGEAELEKITAKDNQNFLHRVSKGYRLAVNKGNDYFPLGRREVKIKGILAPKVNAAIIDKKAAEFLKQDFAINTDSGSHALLSDENNKLQSKVILDQAMLTWSGENIGMASVFSNQEDETNFESTITEGSVDPSTKFVHESMSNFFAEGNQIKGVDYALPTDQKSIPNGIFKTNYDLDKVKINLEYAMIPKTNFKLIFGKDYSIALTPEYKNGFAAPFESLKRIKGADQPWAFSHFLHVDNFTFKRNEPVKPVQLYLQNPLSENGVPVHLREGESLTGLVIRNLCQLDNNKTYKTAQTSVRYILPPEISFQQAFWHNKIFEMSKSESYKWYKKYHAPANEGEPHMYWDKDENWVPLKKPEWTEDKPAYFTYDLEDSIVGSARMRDYYEVNCPINYLSDPLSKGFRFEFFKDKARLIKAEKYKKYEQLEFYFSGKYPFINAWKMTLEDYNLNETELVVADYDHEHIVIRIEKGDEIFMSIRTILHENYEKEFETYGNYNDFTRYGNNDLFTPPIELSLVHATQRPVVRPKFNNILKSNKNQDSANLSLVLTANLEQTNLYYDKSKITKYLEETMPTGIVEIYAKWEEYKDDPKHLIHDDWTPNKPINSVNLIRFETNEKEGETPATFEATIEISKQLESMASTLNKISNDRNDAKNYAVDLNVNYNVRETKYIEKTFWIKNKSKFTSYYPKEWGISNGVDKNKKSERASHDYFNRLSEQPFLVKILNSKKPESPVIASKNIILVSVIEDWKERSKSIRKASMNRLRFFFERGRLTSGKGERIGFVLNESNSKYNDYLTQNKLVSIVGRDVLTDPRKPYDGLYRNKEILLNKSNFNIYDPFDLKDSLSNKKANDLESFFPEYIADLGIMTYLPKFDKVLNLWYLDIELDINTDDGKELHNPFMQFSLVHYQENSFNYNTDPKNIDITKDCRISNIYKSGYVYIMGSRTITINPDFKNEFSILINADKTSIIEQPYLKTTFYCFYEEKEKHEMWLQMSDINTQAKSIYNLKINEKTPIAVKRNHFKPDCRITIIETEYRTINQDDSGRNTDTLYKLLENKNHRIVQINNFNL